MEIDRTITNFWTITINEHEVLDKVIDESLQHGDRQAATGAPALLASDDDRVIMHRYYRTALAELSAVLARRTTRCGGSITNTTDPTTGMITTVYKLGMTANHEDELADALGVHCVEFLVRKTMENWYGHGSDFGAAAQKGEVRHIIHFRREPIERPWSLPI